MHRFRRHVSYANVVSTLCLFIVLGGTAWAAVASNSVGTRQLKNGAVTSQKLATGAVTSGQIADGTIELRDLNPSTIADFGDRCPSAMNNVANLCVDKVARSPGDWNASASNCAAAGLRLPSPSELLALKAAGVLASGAVYWADDIWFDPNGQEDAIIGGTGGLSLAQARTIGVYTACVTTPGNQFSH